MLKSNKPNRLAYKILIEAKTKSPIPSQLKWYNATQDSYDFDWQKTYQIALKCTKSTKLIEFNFRFLHHTLATNTALVKMGFKNDVKCTFCNEEPEKSFIFSGAVTKYNSFGNMFSFFSNNVIFYPKIAFPANLQCWV